MSSIHAAPAVPEKLTWAGGSEPLKASYGKLMMWFFLLSDTFTFSALLVSYGMIRFSQPAWTGAHEKFYFATTHWPIPEKVFEAMPFFHGEAPLVFVGIMTFILIFSSVTMVLAVEAGHRGDRAAVEKWLLWTIIGGFTFLGSQAWEWSHFIAGPHDLAKAAKDALGNPIVGANLTQNPYTSSICRLVLLYHWFPRNSRVFRCNFDYHGVLQHCYRFI
jgi:cytochrome c oxidase subunit 3